MNSKSVLPYASYAVLRFSSSLAFHVAGRHRLISSLAYTEQLVIFSQVEFPQSLILPPELLFLCRASRMPLTLFRDLSSIFIFDI